MSEAEALDPTDPRDPDPYLPPTPIRGQPRRADGHAGRSIPRVTAPLGGDHPNQVTVFSRRQGDGRHIPVGTDSLLYNQRKCSEWPETRTNCLRPGQGWTSGYSRW